MPNHPPSPSRLASLKGTPTVRPEGLPEAEPEPTPPPVAKAKRKGSKVPAAAALSGGGEDSGSPSGSSAPAGEVEERWIDYKGQLS